MIDRSPLSCRLAYFSGPANAYGAAAPPRPTAAAPAAARSSSFRLVMRAVASGRPRSGSGMPLLSFPFRRLAEGASRETGDEAVEERVVEQRERDAGDQDRSHDRGPVEQVAADHVGGDGRRERPLARAGDEGDRVDVLVDDELEREDDDGQDPGQ